MDNNNTAIITKPLFRAVLFVAVLFAAVLPAAAQTSMIPDDFDWSIYLQDWDDAWDGWGETDNQPAQSYYDYNYTSIPYEWYGTSNEISLWDPTPVPQFDSTGSYSDQTYNWQDATWSQLQYESDQWFYQTNDGLFFDEFSAWNTYAPTSAYVSGFNGYEQSYNLDCEARSAVDLAAYFNVNIAHSDFLAKLPKSDDPNEGFVGSYTGSRGQIPPASYGVYQEPVAELLRSYGLPAVGVYAYTDDALKSQIAAGRPVMVWVVGNTEIGYSVPYTAPSTGNTTLVVPYQHTVVVIGYDSNSVTIQDGAMKYSRDWTTFNLSWGALGNRAIYVNAE